MTMSIKYSTLVKLYFYYMFDRTFINHLLVLKY